MAPSYQNFSPPFLKTAIYARSQYTKEQVLVGKKQVLLCLEGEPIEMKQDCGRFPNYLPLSRPINFKGKHPCFQRSG